MKILIDGSEFAADVAWLGKVTDPRIPSLGGILITAGERVHMKATNGETFATAAPPATVLDEGQVLMSGRGLAAIAKELGRSEVTISSDGTAVVIERGRTRWTLPEMDATWYPKFPELGEELGRLPGDVLKDGLRRVLPAVASGDVPAEVIVTTGVEFTFGQGLTLAGCDRRRVATVELPWQPTLTAEEQTLVIPESLLALPMGILSTEEIRLHSGDLVGFATDKHQILGRLFAQPFTNWRRTMSLSDDIRTTVMVDTTLLLGAIKDVGVTNMKPGDCLELAFEPGVVAVRSHNKERAEERDKGDGATSVDLLGFTGEPISVWCQAPHLIDALKGMPGETTTITFGPNPWPCIVLRGNGYRHLVGTLKTPAAVRWATARAV